MTDTRTAWVSWEKLLPEQARTGALKPSLDSLLRSLVDGLKAVMGSSHPLFSPEALGPDGYACAYCVACQYDGNPRAILAATLGVAERIKAQLSLLEKDQAGAEAPRDDAETTTLALLFEIAFYRGFALARLNDHVKDAHPWACLLEADVSRLAAFPIAQKALRAAQMKARVEQAVQLLNQGHFTAALDRMEEVLEPGALEDIIVLLRALGAAQIAALGLGQLARLRLLQAREKKIVDTAGCDVFVNTRLRREIGMLVFLEHSSAAQQLIDEGLARVAGRDGLLEALLRQQQVYVHLVRGELVVARERLTELEASVAAGGYSRGTVNLSDLRYELALRSREPRALEESLREGLADALARGDVRAQMSHQMYMARLLVLTGRSDAARAAILEALSICEREGYGPDFVDCLFHAMGVAQALNDVKLFRDSVLRAGKLARKLSLKTRAACFEYVLSLTSPARERSALPLLELLREPAVASEAWFLLDFYGFLKETAFEVVSATGAHERLLEKELREKLFAGTGLWWFEEPSVLVRMPGAVVAQLPPGSLVRALFVEILESPTGLTVPQVHALTSNAPYHPVRHASKVKTLLHRLRTALADTGLQLTNPREHGTYALTERPECVRRLLPADWVT